MMIRDRIIDTMYRVRHPGQPSAYSQLLAIIKARDIEINQKIDQVRHLEDCLRTKTTLIKAKDAALSKVAQNVQDLRGEYDRLDVKLADVSRRLVASQAERSQQERLYESLHEGFRQKIRQLERRPTWLDFGLWLALAAVAFWYVGHRGLI